MNFQISSLISFPFEIQTLHFHLYLSITPLCKSQTALSTEDFSVHSLRPWMAVSRIISTVFLCIKEGHVHLLNN